jgi:hypothetical protein
MAEQSKNQGQQDVETTKFIQGLYDERLTTELDYQRHKNTFIQKKNINEFDEVTSEADQITSKIPTEPDFIKLYLNDVVVLKGIQSGYKDILFHMLKLMKYENYIVSISKYDKEVIVKKLGLSSTQQVDNAITKLKKAGIIMAVMNKEGKKQRGVYEFNPFLFGKGKWVENYNNRDIHKLTVLYKKNQKEVVNIDAIIEYIKTEKDEEKRNNALKILNKVRGFKEDGGEE